MEREQPPADVPEGDTGTIDAPQVTGAGVPGVDGGKMSPGDDPAVDTTGGIPSSIEEMGDKIYMKHPEVESDPVPTTRMQFDDVWAPRGWVEAEAPVAEVGSVPGDTETDLGE